MNSLVKSVKVKDQGQSKLKHNNNRIFPSFIRELIRIYSKKTSKHTQFVVFLFSKYYFGTVFVFKIVRGCQPLNLKETVPQSEKPISNNRPFIFISSCPLY